jgi:group I intron endonuclease
MAREKKCGVYAIRNRVTGAFYIGSSVDLVNRLGRHRRELRKGTHSNPRLQAAWNKYGEEAFFTEVLCSSTRETVQEDEQRYLDESASITLRYNISLSADNPNRGRRLSEEHRRRIGAANAVALRGKVLTEEHRARVRAASKGNNAGRKLSPEHREKLRQAKLGKPAVWNRRPKTAEEKEKIAAAKRGQKQSPEHREAIRRGRLRAKRKRDGN